MMKKLLSLLFFTSLALFLFGQNMPIRETTPLPVPLQYFGSEVLPDGDVLVFGGTQTFPQTSDETWLYDWETETWTQLNDMEFAVAQMYSVTFANGNVFCIGGTSDFAGKEQRSQIFELSTMEWREVGNFNFFNPIYTVHSAVTLPQDYVLLSTSNGDFSIFDPNSETWSDQPSPGPLDAGGAPTIYLDNGEILFSHVGGQVFIPDNPPTSGNLFYLDPPQPLFLGGVTKLADGKVLTMDLEFSFSNDVSIYDPASRTATIVTEVPHNGGSSTRSALLMPDGKVLTFGFGDITNPSDTQVIEIYDPETNTWETGAYTEIGPLGSPQMHLLPDSSVLAISPIPENIGQGMENKCWILNRDDISSTRDFSALYSISLFPNPTTDKVEIKGTETIISKPLKLELFNAIGTRVGVWNVNDGQIPLSDKITDSGIYFYKVIADSGEIYGTGKIMIMAGG